MAIRAGYPIPQQGRNLSRLSSDTQRYAWPSWSDNMHILANPYKCAAAMLWVLGSLLYGVRPVGVSLTLTPVSCLEEVRQALLGHARLTSICGNERVASCNGPETQPTRCCVMFVQIG